MAWHVGLMLVIVVKLFISRCGTKTCLSEVFGDHSSVRQTSDSDYVDCGPIDCAVQSLAA